MRLQLAFLCVAACRGSGFAQAPEPRVRDWCRDGEEPPFPGATCTDDSLEISFGNDAGPVFEYDDFVVGMEIPVQVILDTRNADVNGWSYSVRHDPRWLTIKDASARFVGPGEDCFGPYGCGIATEVAECLDGRRCKERGSAAGFISVRVLGLGGSPRSIDVQRNVLVRATYEMLADPGPAGTFLEFTDRLILEDDSGPVDINVTSGGRSRSPRRLVDGWVKQRGPAGPFFHRADPDADGRVTVADAVFLLRHLFAGGPAPACLESADFEDSGRIDAADAIALLRWLFAGGPEPASPGPPARPCAPDPTGSPARLGCEAYPAC